MPPLYVCTSVAHTDTYAQSEPCRIGSYPILWARPPPAPRGSSLELGNKIWWCQVQRGSNLAKPATLCARLKGRFIRWVICLAGLWHRNSLPLLFLAVLCAERVGQMTKTYNDIDAVTRLLEEVSASGDAKGCVWLTDYNLHWLKHTWLLVSVKSPLGALLGYKAVPLLFELIAPQVFIAVTLYKIC